MSISCDKFSVLVVRNCQFAKTKKVSKGKSEQKTDEQLTKWAIAEDESRNLSGRKVGMSNHWVNN